MSYNRFNQGVASAEVRDTDLGLQTFMRGVYNLMTIGVGVTGLTAYAVANIPAVYNAIFGNQLIGMAVIFAPLAFILFGLTPARVVRMPVARAQALFLGFAALTGLSTAVIFMSYTEESIARVFFVTAATFAAASIMGYSTRKDLTAMGSFMWMGFLGIFIASIVNIFIGSSMIHFITSILSVVVFTGLTAYETQMLKETYNASRDHSTAQKIAVLGALSLYLSFLNLFHALMHLMGQRE